MPTFNQLQTKVLNLLARRDYSYNELVSKMLSKNFTIEQIVQDFKPLIENKWIDDDRLAENIIRSYQDYKGINWIKQKMQLRQLNRSTIEAVISQWQQDQDQNGQEIKLEELKQKVSCKYKIDNWQSLDWDIKRKVFGFLARSGFPNASNIIRQWQNQE